MTPWFPLLGVKCRCHQSVILLGGLAQGGPSFCPPAPSLLPATLRLPVPAGLFQQDGLSQAHSPAHTCPQAKLKPSEGGFEQGVPSLGISLLHSLLPIMSGIHTYIHLHTLTHIFIYTHNLYTSAHTPPPPPHSANQQCLHPSVSSQHFLPPQPTDSIVMSQRATT